MKTSLRKRLLKWCPQPKNPVSTRLDNQEPIQHSFDDNFRKSPNFFIGLSALLLALGTYLQTLEIPVRITSDPSAADQYDLMHAFWPFSFALWVSALLLLVYSLILGHQQPSTVLRQRQFSRSRTVLTSALGILILFSSFLPWVTAEVSNPVIDIRSYGSINVGQFHELTGFDIIESSYWRGDIMYLVFVAVAVALLYMPILAVAGKRITVARAFLSILGGLCTIVPIVSVATTESWFIRFQFAGGGGDVQATFVGIGIGLMIAAISASGLIVHGTSEVAKLIRRSIKNSVSTQHNLKQGGD